ncbi:3-hydroxyacyl-CoA dehydrogenase family protein [Mesorhizobium sp. 1B3]|uniref:3-hydroxyacyl-CoA dehydrogenase family protein n=1 Tax=Mesorhizobium sp. 1B3 TaxID=3243599 RepID=UPI003D973124
MNVNEAAFGQVTIVGAGLLGHAIGLVHALGGCRVILHDSSEAAVSQALALARSAAEVLVEVGAYDQKNVSHALDRIRTEVDLAKALQGTDLVVEAITEEAEAKRAVYTLIDRHAPEQAVIASNTSYLDIFPLLPERRQARALIVHWYTPPYAIDLVDVVKGPQTEPAVAEAMCGFLRGLGKKPILLEKFLSGYIANRIQTAISLEAFHLIDAGLASAEDIDTAIKYGLAERLALLGHLKRIDYTGLKVTQLNLANKAYSPPELRGRSDVVDRLVSEGKLGVAAGNGFYNYEGQTPAELFRDRDRRLFSLKHALNDIGRY